MSAGRFCIALAAALLVLPAVSAPPPAVTLRPVVTSGIFAPVGIAHAGDGSGRLFIVQLNGAIHVFKNGAVLPTPFLDLSGRIEVLGEGGLLGLAFHPQYAGNRRFFVFYTNLNGDLRVSSFLAAASNPDVADPASELEVITIPHPTFSNHNGGDLHFGPDGYLYISVGDGGAGGDPPNNAQNLMSLLGKLLRLDVTPMGGYAIPPTNPFVGRPDARPEIWAYGLRNPWRFSFDRQTGDLYIGDVGQALWEEIDYVPAGTAGGQNFGWRVYEGPFCYNATSCSLANHTPPILYHGHDAMGGASVTGGYVYRGTRSGALRGYYIYGDFASTRIWAAQREGGMWMKYVLVEPPNGLVGLPAFGEDEAGELYAVSMNPGTIYRIEGPVGPPGTNFALASRGGVASASSTWNMNFPVQAVNDGDRAGMSWSHGGTWNDATPGAFPDWVQIDFDGPKAIDLVVVYSLQDDYLNPVEPDDLAMFSRLGVTSFIVEGWNGAAWVTLATVAGNNRVKRSVGFAPFVTERIRVSITGALASFSRLAEIEAWGEVAALAPPSGSNVALASAGAVASASSTWSANFPVAAVNDGERAGMSWAHGGTWNDATADAWPDWVQIDFSGTKAIDRVVVYSLQDDYAAPMEPTDTMTFTALGVTGFTVEGWNGTAWVPLAAVSANSLVKRTVTFAPFTTNRIRVSVTGALAHFSRIAEIEAWGVDAPGGSNVALASAGATATASSTWNANFPAAAVNDGERSGANWGSGGTWNDATAGAWPDWVEIALAGTKTIEAVVVYSVQDNYTTPVVPSDALTFSMLGVTAFTVEGWNGTAWVPLAAVTGNNRVKRTATFAPFATDRVRVNITGALANFSRIAEIEVWGS